MHALEPQVQVYRSRTQQQQQQQHKGTAGPRQPTHHVARGRAPQPRPRHTAQNGTAAQSTARPGQALRRSPTLPHVPCLEKSPATSSQCTLEVDPTTESSAISAFQPQDPRVYSCLGFILFVDHIAYSRRHRHHHHQHAAAVHCNCLTTPPQDQHVLVVAPSAALPLPPRAHVHAHAQPNAPGRPLVAGLIDVRTAPAASWVLGAAGGCNTKSVSASPSPPSPMVQRPIPSNPDLRPFSCCKQRGPHREEGHNDTVVHMAP